MSIFRRLKRRTVLLAVALSALAPPRRALAGLLGVPSSDPFAPLAPWLDTLIPPDESPGATALGVTDALIAQARGEHGALAGPIARDVVKSYFDKKIRISQTSPLARPLALLRPPRP